MNSKKNIAIVWANPYNRNLGVGALAYSALAILSKIVKDNNIDANFYFFGSSKNTPDKVKIGENEIEFDNIQGLHFYTLKHMIKYYLFPGKAKSGRIRKFDYVFDIGEGDSFTDIYGDTRFRKILNSKKFFNGLGIQQVLLPQTIGPFKDSDHEREAFTLMSDLKMVISRDKQSYQYTRQHLASDKVRETIDVAFYLPFTQTYQQGHKIHVGINVSALLWNGGYTKNNQFGMKTDYKVLITRVIDYFYPMENVRVHLVPHVIPEDQPIENDYEVSLEIQKRYPDVVIAPKFRDPIDAKSYISSMHFFTGARMHACIAAFSTGVPVFPMAYSRKFNGLFGETLQYDYYGDCVNQSTDEVFSKLIESFDNRNILKERVDFSLQNIVTERLNLIFDILTDTLLN